MRQQHLNTWLSPLTVLICFHLIVVYRILPSQQNGFTADAFLEEFHESTAELVLLARLLLMLSDFNVWVDVSPNSEP